MVASDDFSWLETTLVEEGEVDPVSVAVEEVERLLEVEGSVGGGREEVVDPVECKDS